MSTRIQLRRGTAAAWTAANPVLAAGEPGYETDTGFHKLGDGATAWISLPYASVTPAAADIRYGRRRRTMAGGKVIIGGRNVSQNPNQIGGLNFTHHKSFQVYVSATDLVFRFTNFSMAAVKEAVAGSSITIRSSVRVNSQNHEITRSGTRDLVIAAGAGYIDSDPVPVEVQAGTTIIVSTVTTVGSTLPYSTGWADANNPGDTFTAGDLTGPTAAVGSGTNGWFYGPSLIVGTPQAGATVKPAVAILGDSISHGKGDLSSYGGVAGGFIVRALEAASLPWVMVSRDASSAQDWTDIYGRKLRVGLIADCDYGILVLGDNDYATQSRTALQTETDLIADANSIFAKRGARCWVCTMTPIASSTDSWVTVGNQTGANAAARLPFNNWIRAGLPIDNATSLTPVAIGTGGALLAGATGHPVAGYFEVADTVESARDSGLWKAPGGVAYTADGTHPTTAAHTVMAAAITTGLFV